MTNFPIPRILKWFFPQQVSTKLAFAICLLVVILLSLLGMGLTEISRDVLKTKVQQNLVEIAKRAAREISFFVDRPVELLQTASHLIGRMNSSAWDQETALVELSLDFPMFEQIYSVSAQGEEVASSNPGFKKNEWRKDIAFQSAVQGETYYSDVQIGNDYLPHLTISLPYYSLGQIKGVLIAKVNLRGMWDIVDGVRVGTTGRAFVVSKEGILTAHLDKKFVLQNPDLLKINPTLGQMIQGDVESGEYQLSEGVDYVAAKASVDGPLSLVTVVQMERQEAYRFLNQMRFLIWLMISFSLILCIFVSFLLAGWLVRPVRSLHDWSKKVSRGDFDYHISPKSSDEIGQLFIMFKRMSERLKIAREKEQLAIIGEAAATISHKLKNITVSLKTFAQLFPERKSDSVFMKKFEKAYTYNVEYLEQVLKNLSSVSSDGERAAVKEVLAINELLKSICEQYDETMTRANIICDLQGLDSDLKVKGDSDQLRELFVNLMQNAIQAMPKGGLLQIRARAIDQSSLVQVQFIDSGCGMTQVQLNKIFKPFYTTKHGGMGLGMAISKKVVQAHHGLIRVESELGNHTTVTLSFPSVKKAGSLLQAHPETEVTT